MSDAESSSTPDFRKARHPSRVYHGGCDDCGRVVTVVDSALPEEAREPRVLSPASARNVKDFCESFGWGDESPEALQLAIALLLDVTGDADAALHWYEHFAATYVRRLPDTWTIPELDIALWLHCFENARPGS